MSMLCTLSQVKILLNIPAEDTTQDEKLTMLIKSASAKIEGYLGYSLQHGSYVEEVQSVNNRQLLQLNHFPIQSVSSVSVREVPIEDYKLFPEYTRWGRLYRGDGWVGTFYTRGFTHDIVSGAWEVKVSYDAGYYLPNDEGYVEGAEDSLPYDIVAVCMEMVELKYNFEKAGATGLKSKTEGHISESYGDDSCGVGLSESARGVLDSYKYYGVA